MKILVVCQRYWPEQFQITTICEELIRRGNEVTVLTGLPNVGVPGTEQGKLLSGYEKGKNRYQERNGVKIIRAKEIPRRNNLLFRVFNYYSFWKRASKIVRSFDDSFDVVFCYQLSPGMMGVPAQVYSESHDKPFVLYCCDLWPESLKAGLGDKFGFAVNHYGNICRDMYRSADVLVIQSRAFEPYFKEYHGISANKMRYVPHFSTDEPKEALECRDHEGVNIVFMGNMGKVQGIPLMLEAMSRVHDERGDVRLHFVGDGIVMEESMRYVESHNLNKVVLFHGRKTFEELPEYYQMADACILALDDSNAIGLTLPSKLAGYMANGKPIIASAGGGVKDVMEEAQCGYVVPYGDADALATAILKFAAERELWGRMSNNALNYFKSNFTRESFMVGLEKCLVEAIEKHRTER